MSNTSPSAASSTAMPAPAKPRKLFVNIPVSDLQRSIEFFTKLGFTFNPQFTDETATCMLVGEDAYFMLLTREKFEGFASKPVGDAHKETTAMFALTADSRQEVDALMKTVIEAGGRQAGQPRDLGFMYNVSFYDLDGHEWEVFWMDPTAIQ